MAGAADTAVEPAPRDEPRGAAPALAGLSGGRGPLLVTVAIVAAIALVLIVAYGIHDVAQRGVNGLVSGSYFALGAVGLTLVYGTLRLVNFAHGDLLTFGAYMAFLANVTWGVPIVLATLFAVVATAALGVLSERVMWRPMRGRGAGMLQLLLMTLGLAFVIRYGIQMIWGTFPRRLEVDVTDSISFLGLRIGRTELIVVIVGFVVLLAVGLMLRRTSLGRQMRALSDDMGLAEVTGIDTDRVVIATWIFAAGLAGLAGVLYTAAIGTMTPNLGFFLLLSLFAAVILGGIGNAFGALAGGLLLGLAQEWSTLVIDPRWKVAVGFGILILVLFVRPQGLFGRKERTL
ncbi:ABC transporter permease subunit [Conexibacter arvalis]|uniref:Neutral amino acid transport system permease protein n=1 Tax=Conexibacter arvalis TaxID=912552 RepID=A0A840IBC8_9ACTN|nr:neutral amino acid transport system permease protein [Conexibacter arvalis]